MAGIGLEWFLLYGWLFVIAVVLGNRLGKPMDLTVKRLEELIKNTSDIEQDLKQLNFQISEIETAVGKLTDHIVPDNDPPDH